MINELRDRLAECHEQSQAVWNFVVWCSQQDYRGPMPEHVQRACELLTERAS